MCCISISHKSGVLMYLVFEIPRRSTGFVIGIRISQDNAFARALDDVLKIFIKMIDARAIESGCYLHIFGWRFTQSLL